MAFHNSLQRVVHTAIFHGSSNKLIFKLKNKHVFNRLKHELKKFHVQRFFLKVAYRMFLVCFICFVSIALFDLM